MKQKQGVFALFLIKISNFQSLISSVLMAINVTFIAISSVLILISSDFLRINRNKLRIWYTNKTKENNITYYFHKRRKEKKKRRTPPSRRQQKQNLESKRDNRFPHKKESVIIRIVGFIDLFLIPASCQSPPVSRRQPHEHIFQLS